MIWLLIALWFFVGWGWSIWMPHPLFGRHYAWVDHAEMAICALPLLFFAVVFLVVTLAGYGRLIGHETPPEDSDFTS